MTTASAISVPYVSVEEYLHSTYEPDMDYVDGVLEDRNVGEIGHSLVQQVLLFALVQFEEEANILAIQETRTQTQATRFRVPDLCILSLHQSQEQIIRKPALVCIEVLSPDDRLPRVRTKCQDYLRMGVPVVWIFDPQREVAYEMTQSDFREVYDGMLRLENSPVQVDVQAIFASAKKREARLRG